MKKFLLIAALILALVTSLTAGTMASYNQKVDTINGTITAKSFSITADQKTGSFNQLVEIAPGDSVSYTVKVNNASEVRSDVVVKAALSETFEGMTVTITSVENKDNVKKSESETEVAVGGSQEYVITVAWDYEKGLTKDAGSSFTLSIDINGTQLNDNAKRDAASK